ncbi:MAG TPA: hypothetical protein VMX94_06690 [Armatimonadota bacterium]|nr:hypothetical protein [Armatimonadota bacterium]
MNQYGGYILAGFRHLQHALELHASDLLLKGAGCLMELRDYLDSILLSIGANLAKLLGDRKPLLLLHVGRNPRPGQGLDLLLFSQGSLILAFRQHIIQ